MTRNQLTYHANQEAIRHNKATEGIDTDKLAETTRSNKATEALTHNKNQISRETAMYAADKKLEGDQLKAQASMLGSFANSATKLISNFS